MKILVIDAHPRKESLCSGIAQAYAQEALQKKHDVKTLSLRDLQFQLSLTGTYAEGQTLEPDLQNAQRLIQQADHLVWIYPNWWGSFPALLKGFIDRVFLPGFAFKYKDRGFPEQLLKGKTAQILFTLDTPPFIYRWFFRAPGIRVMKQHVLGFCGIKTLSVHYFGPVRGAPPERCRAWIETAKSAVLS